MAVRRKDTGPRRQIRVKYTGESYPDLTGKMVTLKELSAISGIDWQVVYDRWGRRKKPGRIDDSFLVPVGGATQKPFHLLPDDTWHTGRELAGMFGVPASSLNTRKRDRGKIEYTRSELERWGGMCGARIDTRAESSRPRRRPPFDIESIQYQPGPLERALLAL